MVLISSWGKNLRIDIGKCSHSNRTLSIWTCNGWGSGWLTSLLGTTVKNDSGIFLARNDAEAMHIVSLRAKPLDRASRYIHKFYPKDKTYEGILLPFYMLYFMIQTIARTMFSQTFVVHNKMTPNKPMGPCWAWILKKTKTTLFKEWAFMLSNICTSSCYDILISSFPYFSSCFSLHASFHTTWKFLPQDTSLSKTPPTEIMSYRDSTYIPKGHQTYEEIKDSSEKCQREKGLSD